MEKIQYDIIADIRDLLDSLKKQVAHIEARLTELEEAAEEQVEDIALETLAGELAVEQEPSADDLPDDDAVPMNAAAEEMTDGIAEPMPEPAGDDLPETDTWPEPMPAADLPEAGTEAASEAEPVTGDLPETTDVQAEVPIDIAIDIDFHDIGGIGDIASIQAPAPAPEPAPARERSLAEEFAAAPAAGVAAAVPGKSINDVAKTRKTVADAAREKQAWRKDIPGSPVKNIISAISLADRALLINTLFKSDPIAFNDAITAFNGMKSFAEAEQYISENHPGWNMNSDIVYRLMMAIRRKLR